MNPVLYLSSPWGFLFWRKTPDKEYEDRPVIARLIGPRDVAVPLRQGVAFEFRTNWNEEMKRTQF